MAQLTPQFLTSGPKNGEGINSCCSKPPSVW